MVHFLNRQIIKQRQPHQTICVTVTLRERTAVVSGLIVLTRMEAQIVEDRPYSILLEVLDKRRACLQGRQDDIEHVSIIRCIFRDVGQGKSPLCRYRCEPLVVRLPKALTLRLDIVDILQLRPYGFQTVGVDSENDLTKSKLGEYGEMQHGWTSEEAKGFIKVSSTPLRVYYGIHNNEKR